jgi:S-adenosylmethionine-diacylglycerol 3-amino-3-carboxypropyl transferase
MTDFLGAREAGCLDRYILLDAQDWMNAEQLSDLWSEILRTSAPGARVIFRTAGEESPLPGRVPGEILDRWDYRAEESEDLCRRDRSSIYGGFHLYVRRD